MKRFISCYIVGLLLFVGVGQTFALQYQTVFLKKAALKLAVDSILEAKAGKAVSKYFNHDGHRIVAHYDGNGIVDHLGIALFSKEMKKQHPSPIYGFLERAYLDHLYKVSENGLYLNNIQFTVGSWNTFAKVNENMPCSVSNGMDKFYTVKWEEKGKTILAVAFPANYEYFANDTRRNLEQQFVELLQGFKNGKEVQSEKVDINTLGKFKGKNLYVKKGKSYVIPSISSDTYYQMGETPQVEDGDTIYRLACNPVYDKEFPKESFANLLMGKVKDMPLSLVFAMSSQKEKKCQVQLTDFLSYCQGQGCKTFFGYEGEEKGDLLGTLVMHNKASGYDHVIYFSATKKILEGEKASLEGKVYLYTPSTNVKDLFADGKSQKTNRRKIAVSVK